MTLWRAVKCRFDFRTIETTKRLHANPKTLPHAVVKLKGKRIRDAGAFGDFHWQEAELGPPFTFERMTPWNKVRTLAAKREGPSLVLEFLALGGDLNIYGRPKRPSPQ